MIVTNYCLVVLGARHHTMCEVRLMSIKKIACAVGIYLCTYKLTFLIQ